MAEAKAKPILRLNNIEVMFHGTILVLKGISLDLPEGGIIALLGANGAGKTTTLKAISGLLKHEDGAVTDGSIVYMGERIDKKVANELVKSGIFQVMEGRRVFEHLTVEQNLIVGGHCLKNGGNIRQRLEMVYHYFPRLKDLRRATAGFISGGEQQMTVVGRALMAGPKVILLDEPSMGLAPLLIKEVFDIIQLLHREQKLSILLVEQNVKLALSVAPYAYVMETGRIVMEGPSEKLRDNPDIKEFYLGLTEAGTRKSFRAIKHYKRKKRWLA